MKLATERVGRGPKRLVMLHGIFGRGRNWHSIAKKLGDAFTVDLVDLRLHGDSRGFAPPHDLASCARDVAALGAVDVLLGHSFGGKVALLLDAPETWVIDSDPGSREPTGDSWRMLEVLRANPGPFARRDAAVEAIAGAGYDSDTARWMAMNVEENGGAFRWIFDPAEIESLLRDYFARDLWHRVGPSTRFVRGTRSPVLDARAAEKIRERGAPLHEIDAGHWVHTERPDELVALLRGPPLA